MNKSKIKKNKLLLKESTEWVRGNKMSSCNEEKIQFISKLINEFPEYEVNNITGYRTSYDEEEEKSFSWSFNPLAAFYAQISSYAADADWFKHESKIIKGFNLFKFIEDVNEIEENTICNSKQKEKEVLALKISDRKIFRLEETPDNIFYALKNSYNNSPKLLTWKGDLLCYANYEILDNNNAKNKHSKRIDICKEIEIANKTNLIIENLGLEKLEINQTFEDYHLPKQDITAEEFELISLKISKIKERYSYK